MPNEADRVHWLLLYSYLKQVLDDINNYGDYKYYINWLVINTLFVILVTNSKKYGSISIIGMY